MGLVTLVAACGGGSDSSSTASLSKAEIIKAGEAICKQAKKEELQKLVALSKSGQGSGGQDFVELALKKAALPPIEVAVAKISALGESAPDDKAFAAIVAELNKALEVAKIKPTSIAGSSTNNPFEQVDAQAARYGFKTCNRLA